MAKLSDETLTNIFTLQRQLIEGIDAAAAIELAILKQFGETEITIPALEELQNARERQTEPYSRLCTLLLRVAESQPNAAQNTPKSDRSFPSYRDRTPPKHLKKRSPSPILKR